MGYKKSKSLLIEFRNMFKKQIKKIILPRVKTFLPQLKEIEKKFLIGGKRSPFRGKQAPLSQKISLVVPTYNVAKYLDDFLLSIANQSTGLHNLEIIIVNDGSPDNSDEIAKRWQKAYPQNIKYIHQKNQGLSGARNTGIQHATGEWISFPDPDDMLCRHYLHYVNKYLNRKRKKPLILLSCNLIMYDEATDKYTDNHPLNYKYKNSYSERDANHLRDYIQLSAASSFIHLASLRASKLLFQPTIKPTFEDGYLINRLLLKNGNMVAGFVKNAKYFYRKRRDESSLVFSARQKKEWYLDQLEYGYLDLLKKSVKRDGKVPYFIQRTVIYEIAPRIRHLLNHSERVDFLTIQEKNKFINLLDEIFTYIESETIRSMTFGMFNEEIRVGLLSMFKGESRAYDYIYLTRKNNKNNTIQLTYFSNDLIYKEVDIYVNGQIANKINFSKFSSSVLNRHFVNENRFWIHIPDGAELRATISGRPARFRYQGLNLGDRLTKERALTCFTSPLSPSIKLPLEAQRIRNYATSKEARSRFSGCWVLMDRDDTADDNAEHLYRYLKMIKKANNAYFILRKNSIDWSRLEKDGFNLIEYGSDDHIAALVNANILASSHAALFVMAPISNKWFNDLLSYKFVFLQHGVIKDDLSLALGKKPFDIFITSTQKEYESITSVTSNYLFTKQEVKLTGLARHDNLLSLPKTDETILIIPTWRNYLTAMNTSEGAMPKCVDDFTESDFAKSWIKLLASQDLHDLAEKYGKKIVFCPHPNMSIYLSDMHLPNWIETISPSDGISFQQLFANASVLITDYSSVAFDLAYINKPVIYYQFDQDIFFDSSHGYKRGYFDYERDGFGPVTTSSTKLFKNLKEILDGEEKDIYSKRRDEVFAFRDGHCCERIYNEIIKII